jgi:hypothetical protein
VADQVYLSLWLNSFSEDSMLDFWAKLLEAFPCSPSQPGVRGLAVIPFSWGETAVLEQVYAESETIDSAVQAARDFLHPDYAYVAAMNWDIWRQKSFEELAETDVDALIDTELDPSSADELESSQSEVSEAALDQLEVSGSSLQVSTNETLGWKRVPKEVTIACLGPEFDAVEDLNAPESSTNYQNPHFRIDVGLDTLFLPEEPLESEDDEDWDEAALCYRDNISQLLGFMRRIEKALPLKRRLLWSASGDDLGERIREAYSGT